MMSQLSGHWNAEAGKAEKVPSNCITALYLERLRGHPLWRWGRIMRFFQRPSRQAFTHSRVSYSVELGCDLVVKQAFSMCMVLVSSIPTNNQVLFTESPVTPGAGGANPRTFREAWGRSLLPMIMKATAMMYASR